MCVRLGARSRPWVSPWDTCWAGRDEPLQRPRTRRALQTLRPRGPEALRPPAGAQGRGGRGHGAQCPAAWAGLPAPSFRVGEEAHLGEAERAWGVGGLRCEGDPGGDQAGTERAWPLGLKCFLASQVFAGEPRVRSVGGCEPSCVTEAVPGVGVGGAERPGGRGGKAGIPSTLRPLGSKGREVATSTSGGLLLREAWAPACGLGRRSRVAESVFWPAGRPGEVETSCAAVFGAREAGPDALEFRAPVIRWEEAQSAEVALG